VPRLPRLLLTLIPATILIVACGGSSTPGANAPLTSAGGGNPSVSAGGGGGATGGAPTNPPGGGGGANAGIPTIADGTYTSGTAHVEISGGRNDTFDVDSASGVTAGGNTILAFTGADNQKVVQLSFLAPGQGTSGGLSVATNVSNAVFATAGTWGGECQVRITRNNASGLSGEFSCKDANGLAGVIGGKFNIKGTFAAER
jgi:hypothetical protein